MNTLKNTLSNDDKSRIASRVLNIRELNDAGIRFIESNGQSDYIFPKNNPKIWVCIKADDHFSTNSNKISQNLLQKEKRDIETKANKVAESIASTAFTCGAAIFAGVAAVGAGAAAIPTGGLSAPLAAISWAGSVASAASCGLSIGRLLNENNDNDWFNPENNQILDENKAFKFAEEKLSQVSDIATLVNAGSAGKKLYDIVKGSKKSIVEVFKKDLIRNERHQVAIWSYLKNSKLPKKAAKAEFRDLVKKGKIQNRIPVNEISKINKELLSAINLGLEPILKKGAASFVVYILIEE